MLIVKALRSVRQFVMWLIADALIVPGMTCRRCGARVERAGDKCPSCIEDAVW